MKLTRRLSLALLTGILLVHGAAAFVRVAREKALFDTDIARDERVLGQALALVAERAPHSDSGAEAIALVEGNRADHIRVRWVWLDADDADPRAPHVSHGEIAQVRATQPQPAIKLGGDEPALYTYTFVDGFPRPAAIEIADPLFDEHAYLVRSIQNSAIASAVLVGLCGLIAWLMGTWLVGRPVRELVAQARRIGQGDLTPRVKDPGNDELGELAAEMNRMCDGLQLARDRVAEETTARISALEQLRHADRLTSVGTLASGVAHELGTPLNVIEGHAQLALETEQIASVHESAQVILRQTRRMAGIIRQLLDFARRRQDGHLAADAEEVARTTLQMLEPHARRRQVTTSIEVAAEGRCEAAIGIGELQQVLMNIVMNGIDAMAEGGELTVSVRRDRATTEGGGGDMICVAIRDEGVGMDLSTSQRVFEPFFTTKDVGEGTGLGLSVAHGIVEDRGGRIHIDTKPGGGTTFEVHLPVRAP